MQLQSRCRGLSAASGCQRATRVAVKAVKQPAAATGEHRQDLAVPAVCQRPAKLIACLSAAHTSAGELTTARRSALLLGGALALGECGAAARACAHVLRWHRCRIAARRPALRFAPPLPGSRPLAAAPPLTAAQGALPLTGVQYRCCRCTAACSCDHSCCLPSNLSNSGSAIATAPQAPRSSSRRRRRRPRSTATPSKRS